jgi:predicted metal-dependent hydrolase
MTLAAALTDARVLDGLTWQLRVSIRRHTVGLTIERDASVTVVAPAGILPTQLAAAVQAKRRWLIRRSAERAARLSDHPAKQIVSGENFPYLGHNQRLLLVARQAIPVRLEGGRLCLRTMPPNDGAQAIIDWYTRTSLRWVDQRGRSWARRIGVSSTGIGIRDLGRRWGTVGVGSEVALHWALFQLQRPLIDYVLVHELVHRVEPHHGHAFWQRLDRALPDYQARRERLAEAGRQVWLGDVENGRF